MQTLFGLFMFGYFIILLVGIDYIRYHAKRAAQSAAETERLLKELHYFWTKPPSNP